MDKTKCLYYKFDSFSNSEEVGGIIKAREVLESLKETNRAFLKKHPEYVEDYSFSVKELTTELEYYICNKELNGTEES